MTAKRPERFDSWVEQLHKRHRGSLRFSEVRKGVQALSRLYVGRREGIAAGKVWSGAGKRAAFACFYTPLHFLLVSEVVRALEACDPVPRRIVDLGCGLAPAGAAWATAAGGAPRVHAFDAQPYAVDEARWSLQCLGVRGSVARRSVDQVTMPGRGESVVAAFLVNELDEPLRRKLLDRLERAAQRGAAVLIVEPIARRVNPWWPEWRERLIALGGREDHWRFRAQLPPLLAELDGASGLDHRELTGRTLFASPRFSS